MDIDDDDDDDMDFEEQQRFSFSTRSLNHTSVSVPRKSRSRDPHFIRPNPNLHGDGEDSDEVGHAGFYGLPKKKRRLKGLVPDHGAGRSAYEESWSERATAALLEVWGETFVRLGRRSLRAEDWREVAERVSAVTRLERTEAQCRTMLESLKNKYKEERESVRGSGYPSSWGFFRKMEALLGGGGGGGGGGLACGVDAGEFVFADTRVYLDQANGLDEMRDSPGESEASGDDGSDSDAPPRGDEGSVRAVADSIKRFREIYGKVESDKRKQMVDLESMRMDFQRDLELQKRQIMERARSEIAMIRAAAVEDTDDDDDDDDDDLGGG